MKSMGKDNRDKFLRMTMLNNNRRSKSISTLVALHKLVEDNQEVYYSTKNREWFKTRFKDINNCDVEMERVGPDLYKLSL